MLPSIPLAPEPAYGRDQSIGSLVREVTTQLSSLIRSEVELAKAEVTSEVRRAVQGSLFFVIALVVALFSLFFFFIAVAESIALLLPQAAAFGITFVLMLVLAGAFGLLGFLRVRKIRKPERTINTLKDSAQALTTRHRTDFTELNGRRAASSR